MIANRRFEVNKGVGGHFLACIFDQSLSDVEQDSLLNRAQWLVGWALNLLNRAQWLVGLAEDMYLDG